jgi:hypothetical protein
MTHHGLVEAQALVTAIGDELAFEHRGGAARLVSPGHGCLRGMAIPPLCLDRCW